MSPIVTMIVTRSVQHHQTRESPCRQCPPSARTERTARLLKVGCEPVEWFM